MSRCPTLRWWSSAKTPTPKCTGIGRISTTAPPGLAMWSFCCACGMPVCRWSRSFCPDGRCGPPLRSRAPMRSWRRGSRGPREAASPRSFSAISMKGLPTTSRADSPSPGLGLRPKPRSISVMRLTTRCTRMGTGFATSPRSFAGERAGSSQEAASSSHHSRDQKEHHSPVLSRTPPEHVLPG